MLHASSAASITSRRCACALCDEPVRTAAAVIGTVSHDICVAAPPPFMLLKKLQDDVRILLQRTQEQERPPQLQGRPPPAGGALSQEAKRRAVRPPHSGLAQTGGAMPSRAEPPNKKRPRPVPDSTPLAGSVLSFTPSEPLRGPSASEPPPQSSSRPHTDPPMASAPSERAKSPALRLYHEYVGGGEDENLDIKLGRHHVRGVGFRRWRQHDGLRDDCGEPASAQGSAASRASPREPPRVERYGECHNAGRMDDGDCGTASPASRVRHESQCEPQH